MMKSSYADDEGCQYNILVHINLCAINFDIHLLDYVINGWLNTVFFIFSCILYQKNVRRRIYTKNLSKLNGNFAINYSTMTKGGLKII